MDVTKQYGPNFHEELLSGDYCPGNLVRRESNVGG